MGSLVGVSPRVKELVKTSLPVIASSHRDKSTVVMTLPEYERYSHFGSRFSCIVVRDVKNLGDVIAQVMAENDMR